LSKEDIVISSRGEVASQSAVELILPGQKNISRVILGQACKVVLISSDTLKRCVESEKLTADSRHKKEERDQNTGAFHVVRIVCG